MWLAASMATVAVPLLIGMGALALVPAFGFDKIHEFTKVWWMLGIIPAGAVLLYFSARVVVFVVAITSLRSLPLPAYKIVYWSDLIPHM